MAIKIILKLVKHYQLYHFIIKDCQDLLHKDGWRVKIEHCYHEANKVADRLANIGVEQTLLLVVLCTPPNSIRPLLFEDISGVFLPMLYVPIINS